MNLDAYLAKIPGYGWQVTPQFKTEITELDNGDEHRNIDWPEARHVATAPFKQITKAAYRELKKMFYVCRGMGHAFRFRDYLDYEATNEAFGTGDGVTRLFQLNKVSTADGLDYVRNVYALASQPVLMVNGVPTVAFAVNLRTGQVRFDVAPANGAVLTWSGLFDLWVRFANDDMPFSLDHPNMTNGVISVIEVPPERTEIWV